MKQQNDIIVSGHTEQAERWRGMFETQLAEIESAIRSGQTADALGVALVAVKSYPEGLGKCGMGCAAAREQRECRRAVSVLEQLFNRALMVIRCEAAARRLNVAALDSGAIALREAYAPNPHGDGTASATDYPKTGLWPECMTGAELASLTETTRRDLLSFHDTLARLNALPQPDPTPEHAEQGQSGTGKQTRKPRVEWSSNAQDRVANIWKDWKGCHNTQETGGREIDCYNENKADMPDTVKTFADFRACKECARKNRRIPKYNRKRRKTAG